MDKLIMDFNMSFHDRINRLVMGSLLLIGSMATDSVPPWLILFTLYPVLTAIAAWDPVYAVFNLIWKFITDKLSIKPGKLALE